MAKKQTGKLIFKITRGIGDARTSKRGIEEEMLGLILWEIRYLDNWRGGNKDVKR